MSVKKKCHACGGTGVRIIKARSHLYKTVINPNGEYELTVPCECRLRTMVLDWLRPLTIQFGKDWADKHRQVLDSDILRNIQVDRNLLVDGSLPGSCLYFAEALKNNLAQTGLNGFLDYLVTSDAEFRAWYWEHESTNLDEVDWSSKKLLIILIGQVKFSTGQNTSQLLATRIAQANSNGCRVWISYHGTAPRNSKDNINWNQDLEEAIRIYDFDELELNAPFNRMQEVSKSNGSPAPKVKRDKYNSDVDVDL